MFELQVHRLLAQKNLAGLRRTSRDARGQLETLHSWTDAEIRDQFQALEPGSHRQLATALALVSEASRRTLGLEPYDVQLQGAAALFQGVIVEMKTGEGKTLTVAVAAAIAALSREGVHVATVNTYLAQRDCQTMQPLFEFLGLSVGVSLPGQSLQDKQAAYRCDVTYAVHSELGFDYLRDNMVAQLVDRVQRPLSFVIVDEADSILIDEARTPLVISQPAPSDGDHYHLALSIAQGLAQARDYEVDEKQRQVHLTELGMARVEATFQAQNVLPPGISLYEPVNLHFLRYLNAALRAHTLYKRDRDYIVDGGRVKIIDMATGRVLDGRQWQEGLHQAIEAKEGVDIQPENETAAEITYQSLFRLYGRLSGLTGTALSSAEEFESLYQLSVVPLPTHRPIARQDQPDLLFRSRAHKFAAICADVATRVKQGQPILIGTASVQESEILSAHLSRAGIAHQVLNARQNRQEAKIIADAGLPGAVTVATNMAGRGTDIMLGGHTEKDAAWEERHKRVLSAGGLHVIGTTRHESRRVDDQLRGRAGRQGDPGSSQFYLCLEDDLLRIFGRDRIERLMNFAGVDDDAVSGPMLDRAVNTAQKRVENIHYEARKSLAKFDSVMAEQREAVYRLRTAVLANTLEPLYAVGLIAEASVTIAQRYLDVLTLPEQWNIKALKAELEVELGCNVPVIRWALKDELDATDMVERIQQACAEHYASRREAAEGLSAQEQFILVNTLDQLWRAHLTHLDSLREGIHLRSYAQQDPAMAFRKDAYDAFLSFRSNFVSMAAAALATATREPLKAAREVIEVPAITQDSAVPSEAPVSVPLDTPRNAPCPCGSGLRFKHCHGKLN